MDMQHETITFERHFPVAPARVFQAYTNEKEREKWSPPDKETRFEILDSDVRTGGRERAQCGTEGNMMTYLFTASYRSIMASDRRVTISTERMRPRTVRSMA